MLTFILGVQLLAACVPASVTHSSEPPAPDIVAVRQTVDAFMFGLQMNQRDELYAVVHARKLGEIDKWLQSHPAVECSRGIFDLIDPSDVIVLGFPKDEIYDQEPTDLYLGMGCSTRDLGGSIDFYELHVNGAVIDSLNGKWVILDWNAIHEVIQ